MNISCKKRIAVICANLGPVDCGLGGFVFSDWDLRDAPRIARKAAGDKPVIDNLSIKLGGRR
jgi:hypothetical protein